MGFSKPISNQDETFPCQTPTQWSPQALLFHWFILNLHAKGFTFSLRCQNEPTKDSPFHSINQQNVNSQIFHPKLSHVCERKKMKIDYN